MQPPIAFESQGAGCVWVSVEHCEGTVSDVAASVYFELHPLLSSTTEGPSEGSSQLPDQKLFLFILIVMYLY